jgi:hypothetical protein
MEEGSKDDSACDGRDAHTGAGWDWVDLAVTPEVIPVHDWHKEELARSKVNLMQYPASGLTWAGVQRRVRNRYGRCSHRLRP